MSSSPVLCFAWHSLVLCLKFVKVTRHSSADTQQNGHSGDHARVDAACRCVLAPLLQLCAISQGVYPPKCDVGDACVSEVCLHHKLFGMVSHAATVT